MGNLVHLHGDMHEQTLKLLPWYLNGTLDDGEAAMVEAHLVECAACDHEADAERALRNGVTSLASDVDHGWSAMRQKLEAAEAPAARPSFLRQKGGLGWAMAGAMAASLVAVAVVSLQPAKPTDAYRVLGTAPGPAAPVANAVVLFAPDVPASKMRNALAGANARITDGPLASGGYALRIPASERVKRLAHLRTVPGVVIAEPMDASTAP